MDDGDVKDVVAAVRRLVRERVVPLEQQIDESDEVPAGLIEAAAEMGLYGFAIPEEYGGLGLSMAQEAPARDGAWLYDAGVPVAFRH
jgi:acyl-CoA dehydrogenase